jgi:hypothetical protein
MNRRIVALSAAFALLAPAAAFAHFILHAPEPWLAQNPLGDPQKLGPCGGTTANPGTPTNIVTPLRGGDMLHLKIEETVFHPGHYRVALAVMTRSELPDDPMIMIRETPKGPISVSAQIASAKPPILADGLFAHTQKPTTPWETDVKLPNINCDKCTLQVIEFMAEHPYNTDGGYNCHHCADLKITANPALPIDKAWPGQG